MILLPKSQLRFLQVQLCSPDQTSSDHRRPHGFFRSAGAFSSGVIALRSVLLMRELLHKSHRISHSNSKYRRPTLRDYFVSHLQPPTLEAPTGKMWVQVRTRATRPGKWRNWLRPRRIDRQSRCGLTTVDQSWHLWYCARTSTCAELEPLKMGFVEQSVRSHDDFLSLGSLPRFWRLCDISRPRVSRSRIRETTGFATAFGSLYS